MDDSNPREGRLGYIIIAVVFAGSLAGALGWYYMTNRHGIELNTGGFDVAQVTPTQRPVYQNSSPAAQPREGMMVARDSSMSFGDAATRSGATGAAGAVPSGGAHDYKADAKKYEGQVRDYAIRMTNKYPSVRQYGKDWMSYPDLKRLNDEYMRNHDPMAFMNGVAHSSNFQQLIKKYAADPGIRAFLVDGIRQAPGDMLSAAGDALRADNTIKALANTVAQAVGLPSSMTAALNGGQINPNQVMSEVMSNPQLRGAMPQQAPPVNLSGQQ
jgi:hypothetical protein